VDHKERARKGLYFQASALNTGKYGGPDWVFAIRTSIIGSMIADQVSDHMRLGKGAPDEADMARFAEEAAAVADLWEEA
jgi:hypothetical protein